MAKNKITDLRNHLFAQLERLSDEELTPEQLEKEVKRADAICAVSSQIIDTAKVQISVLTKGNMVLPNDANDFLTLPNSK